nr:hypothetical protein [Maricaulis sp.]
MTNSLVRRNTFTDFALVVPRPSGVQAAVYIIEEEMRTTDEEQQNRPTKQSNEDYNDSEQRLSHEPLHINNLAEDHSVGDENMWPDRFGSDCCGRQCGRPDWLFDLPGWQTVDHP